MASLAKNWIFWCTLYPLTSLNFNFKRTNREIILHNLCNWLPSLNIFRSEPFPLLNWSNIINSLLSRYKTHFHLKFLIKLMVGYLSFREWIQLNFKDLHLKFDWKVDLDVQFARIRGKTDKKSKSFSVDDTSPFLLFSPVKRFTEQS